MIHYVPTSLFDSPAQTLVNTVNTVGVMGRGIAAEFKKRYPAMFKQYAAFCKTAQFDIGQLWLYRTPNKWVLNFPTKQHWKHPSKMEYVEAGLRKFVETYQQQGITSISFPQLGCGNGALEWSAVKPLMEAHLTKVRVPVYIHVATQDVAFIPEHVDAASRRRDSSPRERVGVIQFMTDLCALGGQAPPANLEASDFDLLPTRLELIWKGARFQVAVDDLEHVWDSLSQRGALRVNEYPGALQDEADAFTALLLRLPYIEEMPFADSPGVKFSPPPASTRASQVDGLRVPGGHE